MKILQMAALLVVFSIVGCSNDKEMTKSEEKPAAGIIHIGVVTNDLQASLDFYTKVIGMKEIREFSVDSTFGAKSGLSRGVPFDVKVLQLVEGDQATNWKLMSFGKDEAHVKPRNIQDGIGMQYITINVDDLAPYKVRLEQNNIPLLGETPVVTGSGNNFILVQDPDGNFIELIGPMGTDQ